MARNKYPEETVSKILEVSFRLFREKGYDHTTIQDIVNALGMSKGAVYHHFKSKEEIFDQINEEYYNAVNWFKKIRLDPNLSGLQKIRAILHLQFTDSRKHDIDLVAQPFYHDPRLVNLMLRSSIHDAAPFFQQLVEDGIRDGSITVSDPKEFSEALMLLLNIWIGVFTADEEDFMRKMNFVQEFSEKMGLPLLDKDLRKTCLGYYHKVINP